MSLFFPFIIIFSIGYIIYNFFPDLLNKKSWNNQNLFISKSFPVDIEFELLKSSSIRNFLVNFLGSHKEFKIDDLNFDRKTFISSDYTTVSKTIKEHINIKNLISDIISYRDFKSLSIKDNHIFIYFKNNSFTKKQKKIKTQECYDFFLPKIIELKSLFLPALKENLKHEFTKNNSFAKKISNKINKIQNYYLIISLSILGQFLYVLTFNPLNISMVVYPSIEALIFWGISLFLPFSIYIIMQLYGSIRTHLVYTRHLFIFLPLCFLIVYHLLYSLNYILDSNIEETVTVNYTLKVKRGKSISYYFHANTKKEANSPDEFSIKITSNQYNELYGKSKALLIVNQGWLSYQYVTKITPQ